MKFPGESAGEENEQVKLIVAGVFLCRLVIDLHALNLVLIALGTDVFFWITGEKRCSRSLDRAVFGLFRDTDVDITSGRAIGVECGIEAKSVLCPRSNDTGERLALYPFDAEDMGLFLSELLRCFLLGECRREKQPECTYCKQ